MQSFVFSEKTVSEEPRSQILAYPNGTVAEIRSRLSELQALAIECIYSFGRTELKYPLPFRVLGVGYTGIVVLTRVQGRDTALKIRRLDAPRSDLLAEAKFLEMADRVGVGPKLFAYTNNFLLMDYIDGDRFLDWAKKMAEQRNIARTRDIVRQVLEQSFRLDCLGLDRGDMRCISEDALVCDREVVLIDFSAASCDRRPANFTSLAQGLFWGSAIASYLNPLLIPPERHLLIPILRRYKQQPNRENFACFLEAIGI